MEKETVLKKELKNDPESGKKTPEGVDEQGAMHLTRSFWLAFNSINMYGEQHPQAVRAVDAFHVQLRHLLNLHQRILFHLESDGFFCGTWRMDRDLRILRLVDRLKSSGVDAITFEASVTGQGLGFFVSLLIDAKNFRTAKEIEGALKAADVFGIRINRHKYASAPVITDIGTVSARIPGKGPEVVLVKAAKELKTADIPAEADGGGMQEDNELDIQFQPGSLDLGEIPLESPQAARGEKDDREIRTWPELIERLYGEIGRMKGGAVSSARFDRFYETLESLILRYLLVSSPDEEGSRELKGLHSRMEELDWKLLSELDGPLREHQLFEGVGGRLKDRFVSRLALLWADTVWHLFQPLGEENLPAFFSRVNEDLAKSENRQLFLQSLLYLLDERGLPDTLFASVWERLVRRGGETLAPEKPLRLKLPREIESRKEIQRAIETEMYRNNRYASPFSCLSVSLLGVRDQAGGAMRAFGDEELGSLFTFLGHELSSSLRQLDRVGSFGPVRQNHILILLPMTDVTGAVVLMERIENRSEEWKVVSTEGFFHPVLLFSSFTYNAEKVKDIDTLMRKIRAKHRKKGRLMTEKVLELETHQS